MTKSKRKKIIAIAMILTAIVICVAICAVFIVKFIEREQKFEFKASKELVLFDNVYDKTVTLNIPNYIDNFNNYVYIKDPNILELAKDQLLKLDARYEIKIYSDSLLYARIEGEALFYILRKDLFPLENYGMRFSTVNTHDITVDDNSLEKFSTILIPFHLFNAFNHTFDSNFPFQFALPHNKPIKISDDKSSPIDINTFANFYNSFGKFLVNVDGSTITVNNLDNIPQYTLSFDSGYVTYKICN